jgi:tetratricopeptide (TPR) repeat protein
MIWEVVMPGQDSYWDNPEIEDEFDKFVGRNDKLAAFRGNFLGDRPTWMVLSITGEGGVGKSSLLKQYVRIAKANEIEANLILCDDHYLTPVDVMGFVAEELAKLKITHREFNDRYSKLRQLREEAEKDSNAPRGLLNVGAHVVTDIALDGLSRVPGLGSAGSEGFKKTAGDAVSDAAFHTLSRWSNKDEVQLLREPEKKLTPLFMELLNQAGREKRLVVMFDIFEQTGKLLGPWLLDLFNIRYGRVSTRVSFIISGRDQLDQHWTDLHKKLLRLVLEPFELKETREFLINRNITDEALIEQIHKDTAGLPVLVELLAGTNPQPGQPLPDYTKDAVDRFLQWTPPEMRRVALLAAVPRQFNRDILAALLSNEGPVMFEWLSEQSYIRSDNERGSFYHEKVRELMLRHQRNLSPTELVKNHTALAEYFADLQAKMALSIEDSYKNETWRYYEGERIYHMFSIAPEKHWPDVVHSLLPAGFYGYSRRFAGLLLKLAQQVNDELKDKTFDRDISTLEKIIAAYEKDEFAEVIQLLNTLQSITIQSAMESWAFFVNRGEIYRLMGENEEALADFNRAIEMDDKLSWAIARRGLVYFAQGKDDKALTDFNRAIELYDKYAWVLSARGKIYLLMGEHEKVLTDFDRAIKLDEKYAKAIANRGQTHRLMGDYDKALSDFNRAIALEAGSYNLYYGRAETYRLMGKFDDAIKDFTEALNDNQPNISNFARRSAALIAIGNENAAQQDLERALTMECKKKSDHYDRATALILADRIPEALAELEIAFVDRAHRTLGQHDDLLDPIRDLPEFKALLEKYQQ